MTLVMDNLSLSQEFTLDSQMEEIAAKVADGSATEQDRTKLAHLGANRVRLMRRILVRGKKAA